MVIERQRKCDADDKEHCQHLLFIQVGNQQREQINKKDQDFGRDHVGHDRAHKKAFLAFEDGATSGAAHFKVERFLENSRSATDGTP